jgi:hypothetical protein
MPPRKSLSRRRALALLAGLGCACLASFSMQPAAPVANAAPVRSMPPERPVCHPAPIEVRPQVELRSHAEPSVDDHPLVVIATEPVR